MAEKSKLIWVDYDDFVTLLTSFADFLRSYGKHEGPCHFDEELTDPPCELHVRNFNSRESTAVQALQTFLPEFTLDNTAWDEPKNETNETTRTETGKLGPIN